MQWLPTMRIECAGLRAVRRTDGMRGGERHAGRQRRILGCVSEEVRVILGHRLVKLRVPKAGRRPGERVR